MGAWSFSVNGNDFARDMIDEYRAAFVSFDVETALQKLDEYVRNELKIDETDDDWDDYRYSLADFLWKKGILPDSVRETTVRMIDEGVGLEIYADEGPKALAKRQKVLQEFRAKIFSE